MSIKTAAFRDGRIEYSSGVGGATPTKFKPALTTGQGWYMMFSWKSQTTLNNQPSFILGNDGGDEVPNAGSEFGVTLGATGAGSKLNFYGRNGSATDIWAASSTSLFSGMTAAILPASTYLIAMGVQEVGGAGIWRLWRAVYRLNAGVATQIGLETLPPSTQAADWATNSQEIIDQIFGDSGGGSSTKLGTAIENVVMVNGLFPFVGTDPDPAILTGLTNGTYNPLSPAVLGSGSIFDWRRLTTITDLGDYSGNNHPALTLPNKALDGSPNALQTDDPLLPWFSSLTINGYADGYVFEGALGPSLITFTGSKKANQAVQFQILNGAGGSVRVAWTSTGVTYPGGLAGTTWAISYAGLPTNPLPAPDYQFQIRDAAVTTDIVTSAGLFGVGIVTVFNSQSQGDILFKDGKPTNAGAFGTGDPVAPNNVRIGMLSTKLATGGSLQVTRATTANTSLIGSAAMAAADQHGVSLGANTGLPAMLVDGSITGMGIGNYIDNSPTGSWTTQAFINYLLGKLNRRITSVIKLDVVVWSGGTLTAALTSWEATVDSFLSGNTTLGVACKWWGMMCVRAGDGVSTTSEAIVLLRQQLLDKIAAEPSRWSLLSGAPVNMQGDQDNAHHQAIGSPAHQVPGAQAHIDGNRRLGCLIGQGIAYRDQQYRGVTVTVDPYGPQIVSVAFTDGTRTAFDITFDRDIRTTSGLSTNLPQFWTSENNWASKDEWKTGVMTGRKVRVSRGVVGGAWLSTSRFDYIRDYPLPSAIGDAGSPTIVNGGEINIAEKLNLFIHEAGSSFDKNRGMIAALPMGNGLAIADASAASSTGTLTVSGTGTGTVTAPAGVTGGGTGTERVSGTGAGTVLGPGVSGGGAGTGRLTGNGAGTVAEPVAAPSPTGEGPRTYSASAVPLSDLRSFAS